MTDLMTGVMPASRSYLSRVEALLTSAIRAAEPNIAAAGALIAECFARDGILYVFGSGHSHIFAEEAFYRAGGAARICPILQPDYMLHVSARHSTELERESGLAPPLLDRYAMSADDVLLVVSNSGANSLPVEVAETARERGIPVVAITSVAYASASSQRGARLHDVADIVLDNQCPPGDALVALRDDLPRVGPGSSVVGLALLNAVIVEALARQVGRGQTPDIYLSAGMPHAAQHNAETAERFSGRIPHL